MLAPTEADLAALQEALCEVLIRHGARIDGESVRDMNGKTPLDECRPGDNGSRLRSLLTRWDNDSRSNRGHGAKERPPRYCPCGSGDLFASCHGQEGGRPVHSRTWCPCKSTKRYGRCCEKKGMIFRETLESYTRQQIIAQSPGQFEAMSAMRAAHHDVFFSQNPDATEEDFGKQPIFGDMTPEEATDMSLKSTAALLAGPIAAGNIDPGWAFASTLCDFKFARPWRVDGKAMVPMNEMQIRMDEWNSWVDRYIKEEAAKRGDHRTALEISKQCKVDVYGGTLHHPCANRECAKVEEDPVGDPFMACSRCKMACFCSRQCFKTAWKATEEDGGHKAVCGTSKAEARLSSEIAASAAMNEMNALMGGMGGGEGGGEAGGGIFASLLASMGAGGGEPTDAEIDKMIESMGV